MLPQTEFHALIAGIFEADGVDGDSQLSDLLIDSMGTMEMLASLGEHGADYDRLLAIDLASIPTVGGLYSAYLSAVVAGNS